MSKAVRTQFDALEMAELEAKECDMVTPYQGSKGDYCFSIDKKEGIVLDYYKMRGGRLANIETQKGLTFEQLIDKL